MRLRHLQFHILVPSSPNDFLVSGTERTQTTQEDRFLGSYNPVQPRHRRSKQSGCLPILERDIQRTSPIDRSDPADDYVIGQIEENECGPELAGRAGSEGKLANENRAEHLQRRESYTESSGGSSRRNCS